MSKVKEQLMLQEQDEYELELSYQEWLRDNKDESIDVYEGLELQQSCNDNSTVLMSILSMNNDDYKPIGGA